MATSTAQAFPQTSREPAAPSARRTGMPIVSRLYHFSVAGVAYATTTCVLLIGAINGQNNLLFALFGIAVGGLVVSGVLSGWSLMGLRLERDIIDPGEAGGTLRVRYRITNHNRLFGAFGLVIEELPEARTWLAKKLIAQTNGRIEPVKTFAAHVPTRTTITVDATTNALARGTITLGPVRITSTFPFGLTRKSVTFHDPITTWIRPALVTLKPIELPPAPARQPRPTRTTTRHAGSDFFALRSFQPGDSVRAIAWRASARADEPIVRIYADRPGHAAWILLDDTPADPIARERAIAAAGALASQLLDAKLDVALATTTRGQLTPLAKHPAHLRRILDALARLDDEPAQPASRPPTPPQRHASITLLVTPAASSTTPADAVISTIEPKLFSPPKLPQVDFRPDAPRSQPGGAA